VPARSAGILLYRLRPTGPEVLLVHPGGPYWARRDHGAWSIPKGEIAPGEEPLACALRELEEETGNVLELGELIELGEVRQRSGKCVQAWAAEADLDPGMVRSNNFELEWPPRSGRMQEFPEVDRAAWFGFAEAKERLLEGQVPLLERLAERLHDSHAPERG
jgi:predicted NUDIX family NTP pyrophosphohydrolase